MKLQALSDGFLFTRHFRIQCDAKCSSKRKLFFYALWEPCREGGISIWGVHGGVPQVRVIFSRRNSEKGMSIFHKSSRKGYNICKKFQIGSVILMTPMTNQKKTELINFFDLFWTKNPQFLENVLKMEAIFSQNSPQNRTLEPPLGIKIPKRVQLFHQKFQKGSI